MGDDGTAGLLGREAKFADPTGLLDRAAGQRGGALVLREAGVGKARWRQAAGRGLTVLSSIQYQAELELPYAGLNGLLKSAPGHPARENTLQLWRLPRIPDRFVI